MSTRYVIVAEDGGGTDLQYAARFHFDSQAEALAAFTKLANITAAAFNLATLAPDRKAPEPIHSNRLNAALAVLHEMDADATATTRYRMYATEAFVSPSAPPANAAQALFQAIRDLAE